MSTDHDAAIDAMTRLEPGWDGWDAPPPSAEAIRLARQVLALADGEKLLRVQASVIGGIGFTFRTGYLEVHNDGEIVSVRSSSEDVWTWTTTGAGLKRGLERLTKVQED